MRIRLIILILITVDLVESGCTRKVYVLPLFSGAISCSDSTNKYKDQPKTTCGEYTKEVVQRCSYSVNDKKREQIALLLPDYTQFTLCYLGSRGDCDSIAISQSDVVLKQTDTGFDISNNLKHLLAADFSPSCIDDSMGIIITDVPCKNLKEHYPDLKKMFDTELNKTIKEFDETFYLHTVVYWLVPDSVKEKDWKNGIDGPCSSFINYNNTFDETKNFLQVRVTNYSDFAMGGKICDKDFPNIRPNSLKHTHMSQALTIGLSIGCSIVGLLILVLIIFCVFRVRRRYIESKMEFFVDQHTNNQKRRFFFIEPRPLDEWEITPKELKVEANVVLGTGISGTVYKGHMKKRRNGDLIEMDVAVKFAHNYADSSVRKDMIREIEFMKTLGHHQNLLVMVGCVKDPENPVIATEYCERGDLLKILRKHELHYLTTEKCSKVDVCLLLVDLLRISLQVCSGMAYLTSLKYVHRDLAARNVMIMNDMTARVGDFGLCRLANESLYVQKGGKLPVKHMSHEALKFGEFSEKSDVWAYGILLFEMFTGGERPFADIETEELIKHLADEGKPELPDDVPEQLTRMINAKCFAKESSNRGTFEDIQFELNRIVRMFDI